MHHGAESHRADSLQRNTVFFRNFFAEILIAFLQASPHIFEAVCPDAVLVPILPLMAARRERRMILTDQHRLDTSGTEFDAKHSSSTFNCSLNIVSIHVHLP